jgi:hypothetical protein
MHCPKCKSHNISRSRSRGYEKLARFLLARRYYRCQSCDWRGSKIKGPKIDWQKAILILIYAVLFFFLIRACINYSPPEQSDNGMDGQISR